MAPPGREDSAASVRDLALQEELDVKDQINKNLKKALEAKTREAEAAKAFLIQTEAILRPFLHRSFSPSGCQHPSSHLLKRSEETDAFKLPRSHLKGHFLHLSSSSSSSSSSRAAVAAAAAAVASGAGAFEGEVASAVVSVALCVCCCSGEEKQQLLLAGQQTEGKLQEAEWALKAAAAEAHRLADAEAQRDAFRLQLEAQQQSLEQQAFLIDGLKQRCSTLEAEKQDLLSSSSTTAEGGASSFRSLFFSWGPQHGGPYREGPRQRRAAEVSTGDVLAYTVAEGLEEGLRGEGRSQRDWWCCCRRRRRYYSRGSRCVIQ
ncbi:hypothetical protein Efla_007270 [Eimeria flavescens]